MSVHLKLLRSAKIRRTQRRLKILKRVTENQENRDPGALLEFLLDEKSAFLASNGAKNRFGRFSIRNVLVNTGKFTTKIFIVMLLQYVAAVVFAYLEDTHESNYSKPLQMRSSRNSSFFSRYIDNNSNVSLPWKILQNEHHISVTENELQDINKAITVRVKRIRDRNFPQMINDDPDHLKIQKWFYFVIIASTTIGYGDVCPQTQNGKIFYIFFSIIGIVLMMWLLKSCGEIVTSINRRLYRVVRRYATKVIGMRCWSEEVVSLVSSTLLLVAFLAFGVWHDSQDRNDNHTIVDIIYFWVVSFTTTGFGDIGHSLEFEIQHAYELTVYRVFGLSLVAAIIDSIFSCVAAHGKRLKVETIIYQRKLLKKIQSGIKKARLFQELGEKTSNISSSKRTLSTSPQMVHLLAGEGQSSISSNLECK